MNLISRVFCFGLVAFLSLATVQADAPRHWNPWMPLSPSWQSYKVEFINNTGRAVGIYSINGYGGWSWRATLRDRERISVRSPNGGSWAATDSRGRIIKQVRVRGENVSVRLGDSSPAPAPSRSIVLAVQNERRERVHLLIEEGGRYVEVGRIEPRSVRSFRVPEGRRYSVVDDRWRSLRNFTAGAQDFKVEVK